MTKTQTTEPRHLIVRVPPAFYDDHVARDLPAGEVRKRGVKFVEVALNAAEYSELLSDARHYAASGADMPEHRGVVASAKATVKALEAADGFSAFQAAEGGPVTETVDGEEVVTDHSWDAGNYAEATPEQREAYDAQAPETFRCLTCGTTYAIEAEAQDCEYAHASESPEVVLGPTAATNPVERLRLAKEEHLTLKAWIADGSKPPRPATPNLDAINAEHAPRAQGGIVLPKQRKSDKATAPAGVTVRFHHDGVAMPDSQNKLSSVAYYYTKGLGADGARLTTTELRDLLAAAGIADPANTEWTHTLANGVVLSTKAL